MKVKTFVITFILLILSSFSLNAGCTCYYKQEITTDLTINSCDLYSKIIKEVFNQICEIKPLPSNKEEISNNDILVFSGFGCPKGLFNSNNYDDFNKTISWDYIASLGKTLLIVDACYSGKVLDYQTEAKYILTSSNSICPSWNVFYQGKWLSSASITLACLLLDNFYCPIPIDDILYTSNYYNYNIQLLLQTINIKILLKFFRDNYNNYTSVYVRSWENFCVGTINFYER